KHVSSWSRHIRCNNHRWRRMSGCGFTRCKRHNRQIRKRAYPGKHHRLDARNRTHPGRSSRIDIHSALSGVKTHRYTCPCWGYITLSEWPGSYGICHVCFWEDDPLQILDPWFEGGANRPSLVRAQATFVTCRAIEQRFRANVKGVLPGDVRDPQWRPVAEYDR